MDGIIFLKSNSKMGLIVHIYNPSTQENRQRLTTVYIANFRAARTTQLDLGRQGDRDWEGGRKEGKKGRERDVKEREGQRGRMTTEGGKEAEREGDRGGRENMNMNITVNSKKKIIEQGLGQRHRKGNIRKPFGGAGEMAQ